MLSGLKAVTADQLAIWPSIRTQLVTATTDLEGVDSRNAVSAVDTLVAGATKQLADWRAKVAKVTARNQKATADLTAYVTAIDTALTDRANTEKAASAFLTLVGKNPELTSQQAVPTLDGQAIARDRVLASLTAATPPRPLTEQHQALLDVADRAVKVVASGYEGTKREKCGTIPATEPGGKPTPAPCYYRDTAGWTAFSTGTTQTAQAFTPAKEAWDEAVATLRTEIAARKLPVKPVV